MLKISRFLALASLAFLVLLVYFPVFHGQPLWDDQEWIFNTTFNKNTQGLWLIWTKPWMTPQYYPLTMSLHWLLYRIFGEEVLGYHLVTTLMHLGAGLVLWRVLRRLAIPGALLAAALFLLHPVQVESVAWMVELKNTLSGLLCMLSLWAYLEYDPELSEGQSDPLLAGKATRPGWYALSMGLFALALLSKTSVGILPLILLILYGYRQGHIQKKKLLALLPMVVMTLAIIPVTIHREALYAQDLMAVFQFSFLQRLMLWSRTGWFYLQKLLIPWPLVPLYPRWPIETAPKWYLGLGLLTLTLVAGLWSLRKRLGRGPLAATLIFLVALLPVSGLINFNTMRFTFVADHYQYLAMIAMVTLLAAGWVRWFGIQEYPLDNPLEWRLSRRALASLAVLILPLVSLSMRHAYIHADAIRFWQHTIAYNPAGFMGWNNLAAEEVRTRQFALARDHAAESLKLEKKYAYVWLTYGAALGGLKDYKLAEAAFRQAMAMDPKNTKVLMNLARILEETERSEAAIACYWHLLTKCDPNHVEAWTNMGYLLAKRGEPEEAIKAYRHVLELSPNSLRALYFWALALQQKGATNEALGMFQQILTIDANHPGANFWLGFNAYKAQRYSDAMAFFDLTLQEVPDFGEANYHRGLILLHDQKFPQALEAFDLERKAHPGHWESHYNSGLLLAQMGRWPQAYEALLTARQLRPESAEIGQALGQVLERMNRRGEASGGGPDLGSGVKIAQPAQIH